jgi:hypothetical protein
MDQAVGLPALNGCFIDGIFFVANHLTRIPFTMSVSICMNSNYRVLLLLVMKIHHSLWLIFDAILRII